MTDIVTYCDIYKCEECPRYGDDCDGSTERLYTHKEAWGMTDLIRREDAVNEIHKYFVAEIDKTPTVIDEDGDELYADMTTVNSLLACNKELSKRIKALPSAEAEWVPETGECKTCKRNANNGGFYDDGRTRCPIQEHYVLLKDGYCHLYEPYKGGDSE